MTSDAGGPSPEIQTPMPAPAASPWVAERHWTDGIQKLYVNLDASLRSAVVFDGPGTMDGARALIAIVDEVRLQYGPDTVITSLVDMRRLQGAPLRCQFLLGKWMLSRRKQIEKVACFGGAPFDMGLARAVMTIAGMGKKAHFGQSREDALAFLGWPAERYPR